MVNFDLIIQMIDIICLGDIPKGQSFNEFSTKFYLETKMVPLSKFLKMRGYSNKMPKIMNTRKAGEVIFESRNSAEILELLKKEGYNEIPQLNYSAAMVLRKAPLDKNWRKMISYLKGDETIDKIIKNNKKMLLPEERNKINEFLQSELNISTTELNWLLDKFHKIDNNKKVYNSLSKLL